MEVPSGRRSAATRNRISSWSTPFCTPLPLPTSLYAMVFSRAFAVAFVFLAALVDAATYTGKVQVINGEGSSNGFLKNWSSGL